MPPQPGFRRVSVRSPSVDGPREGFAPLPDKLSVEEPGPVGGTRPSQSIVPHVSIAKIVDVGAPTGWSERVRWGVDRLFVPEFCPHLGYRPVLTLRYAPISAGYCG